MRVFDKFLFTFMLVYYGLFYDGLVTLILFFLNFWISKLLSITIILEKNFNYIFVLWLRLLFLAKFMDSDRYGEGF